MQIYTHTLPGGAQLIGYLRDRTVEMPAFNTRPAILILPGGGYAWCSRREADPVAMQFLQAGYNVFTLYYTCRSDETVPALRWQPLIDAAGAILHIRRNAEQFGTDPAKIAICGFSAGGHLAASTAILWDAEPVQTALGIHGTEARPDAVVRGYPVITAGEYRHDGSIVNLCGDDADLRATMSLENQVRDGLPGENHVFASFDDALHAYDCRSEVDMQAKIQVRVSAADAIVIIEDGTRIFRVKNGKYEVVDYDVTGNKTARFETSIGSIIFNRQCLPEA